MIEERSKTYDVFVANGGVMLPPVGEDGHDNIAVGLPRFFFERSLERLELGSVPEATLIVELDERERKIRVDLDRMTRGLSPTTLIRELLERCDDGARDLPKWGVGCTREAQKR
ncbi:MAG: hypothetical protein ACRD16_16635 [Thermoanaerobaculia bacterium]